MDKIPVSCTLKYSGQSQSVVRLERGKHRHNFSTYTYLSKESGKAVISPFFKIGKHEWQIVCYPGGETEACAEYLSIFLGYKGPDPSCTATWKLRLVNQANPKQSRQKKWAKGDKYNSFTQGRRWGWQKFIKSDKLEETGFLKNDTIIVEAILDVHLEINMQEKTYGRDLLFPILPRGDIALDFGYLLKNEVNSDVRFVFSDGSLLAHSQILCARSPVLQKTIENVFKRKRNGKAQKQGNKITRSSPVNSSLGDGITEINIPDVECLVFEEFLKFLYTDQLSWFKIDEIGSDSGRLECSATKAAEKKRGAGATNGGRASKRRKVAVSDCEDSSKSSCPTDDSGDDEADERCDRLLALFALADMYEINRLRLICEHKLCSIICSENVLKILDVAETHNATQLKRVCLKIVTEMMDVLAKTEEFKCLRPELMQEVLQTVANRGVEVEAMQSKSKLENVESMNTHELRRYLAERGISAAGNHEELFHRLRSSEDAGNGV